MQHRWRWHKATAIFISTKKRWNKRWKEPMRKSWNGWRRPLNESWHCSYRAKSTTHKGSKSRPRSSSNTRQRHWRLPKTRRSLKKFASYPSRQTFNCRLLGTAWTTASHVMPLLPCERPRQIWPALKEALWKNTAQSWKASLQSRSGWRQPIRRRPWRRWKYER